MFVVVPKALAPRIRKALAKLEGLPIRGITYGAPDCVVNAETPGPGWTTDAVEEGVDDGANVCIELPDHLQKWCGKTVTINGVSVTLPTLEQLKSESALPDTIKAARAARRAALPTTNAGGGK